MRLLAFIALTACLIETAVGQTSVFYPGKAPNLLAPRSALVIGVPQVTFGVGFPELNTPYNDATAVAAALRKVGFQVIAPHESISPESMTRQTINAPFTTLLSHYVRLVALA